MADGSTAVISKSDLKNDLAPFQSPEFAEPVEELIKLLSQSKRAFLIGAGCSKCAGLPLMYDLTKQVIKSIPKTDSAHAILTSIEGQYKDAAGCTIEDYMSELVDLVSIAERRAFKKCINSEVKIDEKKYSAKVLRGALGTIKQGIRKAIHPNVKIHYHREFIRAVHNRLNVGKSGPKQPVDYYTLNYDTLLEDALSLECVPLADGFNGGATGWWNIQAYQDPLAQARVFKVHGSIDWCLLDDDVLPRRVRPSLNAGGERESVLIWPASTKYREAQRDPHAQILNMLRQTLRPELNGEVVLAVLGYSFGDRHINEELDLALRESGGRLTVLVFTYDDKPVGLVKKWFEDPSVREHVRIHAKKGFFHAGESVISKVELPWWQFETLIRILGGDR